MSKAPRELLKFRPGDVGLKIKKDGQMEVAGVSEESPMIDNNGKVNPALLFAAAWARKDQKVFEVLVQNFKDSVLEGYFGSDAQTDYKRALAVVAEKEKNKPSAPFLNPEKIEEPVLEPSSKPNVSTSSLGNEFETHSDKPITDVASGAITFEQPKPGVTTWPGQDDKPIPMTVDEQLDRRDT